MPPSTSGHATRSHRVSSVVAAGDHAPKTHRSLGWRDAVVALSLAAAYVAFGLFVARTLAVVVDPDAVAYAQIARHYLNGHLDLALNTWWGPALSWLLVPGLVFGLEPQFAARVVNVLAGLTMALGVSVLTWRLAGPNAARWGFVLALAATLHMLNDSVTPDLVLASVVTWYIVVCHAYLVAPNSRSAIAAGLVGGIGALIKAYALPFAIVNTLLVALAALGRGASLARTARHAVLSAAAVVLVAAPWLVTISLVNGAPTLGSAGAYAASFARLERHPVERDQKPMFELTSVQEGRITNWEAPRSPVPRELPPIGSSPIVDRAFDLLANIDRALAGFRGVDGVGLLLSLALLAAVSVVARPERFGGKTRATLAWLAAATVVYVGGYVLLLVEARFLWPAIALAIAFVVATAGALAGWQGNGAVSVGKPPLAGIALAVLLALTLAWGARTTVSSLLSSELGQARLDRDVGRALAALHVEEGSGTPQLVGNDWLRGLRIAYWSQVRFLGRSTAQDAASFVAAITPYAPQWVVLHADPALSEALLDEGYHTLLERDDVIVLVSSATGH